MKVLRRFFKRLFGWTSARDGDDRLRVEIEDHLASLTAELEAAGFPPAEARRQAALKFGGVAALKEEYREQRGLPFMETLVEDTRQGLRRLRKAPAFSIATIATLALGLGATTSIFTLVHAILMKSLPVAQPEDLYRLGKRTHCCMWGGYSQYQEFSLVSTELYTYFRDHTQGFAELAAFEAGVSGMAFRRVSAPGVVETGRGEFVSGNYFSMFGIKPYIGRMLGARDDREGAPPVAVMSFRLWEERYGADSTVVGSVFNINDKPVTIVGVTPPGFFGDSLRQTPPDIFIALSNEPLIQGENSILHIPDAHWLDLIGRVKPGVAPAALEAQMRVELKQWLRSHWGQMNPIERQNLPQQILYLNPGGAGITSMREAYEQMLKVLMLASGLVLLIVCANVGNLMLVRGMERRPQTSLSMALGARPFRLIRQTLTESLLLSLLGGAVGLAVAYASTLLILHFAFPALPGVAGVPISASPSLPVLFFAFLIAMVTGLAFGMGPAWMATQVDPIEALRGANRATGRTASLPRKMLVITQVALSLAMLSVSGLLTEVLGHLEDQDFGFAQERRIVAHVDPQLAGYKAEQLSGLYRRIKDSLGNLPGVSTTALCSYSPQSGDSWNDSVFVDGHPTPGPKDDNGSGYTRVTGQFFDAIGNQILKGRPILDSDTDNAPHVAVVNEAFVKKFFKHEDPIGKHFGRSAPGATHLYEIVGVAKDGRYLTYDLDQPIGAFFFVAAGQRDVFPNNDEFTKGDVRTHFLNDIVIVTKPEASLTAAELRHAIAKVDANLPVNYVLTMKEQVAAQFIGQRLMARLTSGFGLLSLLLASIGLYGVTAYNAGRRVTEIGLRMALGASRGDVMALVLRGALGLLVVGVIVGVPLSFGAARFLGSQLYGVSPYDMAVTAVAVVALSLSAFIAAGIPALRASSISPMQSLRSE